MPQYTDSDVEHVARPIRLDSNMPRSSSQRSGAICSGHIQAIFLTSALVCLPFHHSTVAAQEKDDPTDPLMEEIIVTAQYREQRLQDVPISISAFQGEDLRDLRITTPADIARITPGLFMNRSSVNQSDPEFTIRGIGTKNASTNQNPASPLYIDGISVPFNAMVGHVLFDMERVEVLKGPQGTLYGRNSTAGAINFISTRPGPEREGYFTLSYGERDRTDIEGAFTVPLSDTFFMRFAAVAALEDGWQTIDVSDFVTDNDPSFLNPVRRNGDVDTRAMRISALWQPSEAFEMLTTFDIGYDDSQVLGFKHAGNMRRDNPSQFCIFSTQGIRDDVQCASQARDSRTGTRIPVSIGGKDLFVMDPNDRGELVFVSDPDPDPRTTIKAFSMGSQVDAKATGFTNNAVWSPNRFNITSITGFRSFERVSGFGQQGGPFNTIGGQLENDIDVFTQELRIASDSSWDNIYWVGGLFYSNEEIFNANIQNLAEHHLFSAIFRDSYTQDTDIYAAFGQAEWNITDKLQLVGGARYTSEDRSFDFTGEMRGFGPVIVPEYSEKVSSKETTWRAGVNYRPADNAMWYASVSTGFRGKGFPASIAFSVPQLFPFDEETLTAYEAGFKSMLFDGALQFNTSLYYYDFEDFQAQTAVEREGLRLIVLANAGDGNITGAEVDMRWFATEEFSIGAGVNWMDNEITSGDHEGQNMIRAPDLMLNGLLSYDSNRSIGGFSPFARLDVSYNSEMDFILPNHIAATEGSYWLLNARVGIRLPDNRWELSLWVENLTDETYRTEVFGPGSNFLPAGILFGGPRMYGATVRYVF